MKIMRSTLLSVALLTLAGGTALASMKNSGAPALPQQVNEDQMQIPDGAIMTIDHDIAAGVNYAASPSVIAYSRDGHPRFDRCAFVTTVPGNSLWVISRGSYKLNLVNLPLQTGIGMDVEYYGPHGEPNAFVATSAQNGSQFYVTCWAVRYGGFSDFSARLLKQDLSHLGVRLDFPVGVFRN